MKIKSNCKGDIWQQDTLVHLHQGAGLYVKNILKATSEIARF